MSFFDQYLDYVDDNTECPLIYHRWCSIALVGAVAGRHIRVTHGHSEIYPNMYIMLIGPPATRKSTAVNIAKRVAQEADYTTISGSKTSKEKWLLDFAEGFGEEHTPTEGGKMPMLKNKRYEDVLKMTLSVAEDADHGEPRNVWIVNGEFNNFLGYNNLEFVSILGDLWDNLPYFDVRNKNSQSLKVHEPSVNILGGNTQQNLASSLPPEAIGQGFTSRWLLIQASKKRWDLPFPPEPDPRKLESLANSLRSIRELAKRAKTFTLTEEAKEVMAKTYGTKNYLEDGRFEYYFNRRFVHLFKLCQICALAEMKTEITAATVVYANSILSYAEQFMPAALGEFGKSKFSDLSNAIMALLRSTPMTPVEIYKKLSQDCNGVSDVSICLQNLNHAGKVKRTAGKLMHWEAVDRIVRDSAFVDFSLLYESGYNKDAEMAQAIAKIEGDSDKAILPSLEQKKEISYGKEESITDFLAKFSKQKGKDVA